MRRRVYKKRGLNIFETFQQYTKYLLFENRKQYANEVILTLGSFIPYICTKQGTVSNKSTKGKGVDTSKYVPKNFPFYMYFALLSCERYFNHTLLSSLSAFVAVL